MTLEEFMLRCARAGCVVAPVRAYAKYNAEGNVDESDYIGVRYSARSTDGYAVATGSYWFMVDECGLANFETPESALEFYESLAYGAGAPS